MNTMKDEYTKIQEDKELNYPFENLCSALDLRDLFKLKNEYYVKKVF